jgi:ABC-type uncharacterized transport system auxiliary subunit
MDMRASSTNPRLRTPGWQARRRGSLGFFLAIVIWVSGCGLGERQIYLVRQYILEYPPPMVEGIVQTDDLIKVERFSVVRAFNTTAMLYRDGPYTLNSDPYNRWRANPGEMVPDYLVRDLRKVKLFRAVYSYHDIVQTRYVLQGEVEDFLEVDEGGSSKAVLKINVTFLDLAKKELPQQVIFQKNYRAEDPLSEKTAAGLAQAMSRAMEKISRELVLDLRAAIQ